MLSELKDLFDTTYVIVLEKSSDVVKAIETSGPMKTMSRTIKEILTIVRQQLKKLQSMMKNPRFELN